MLLWCLNASTGYTILVLSKAPSCYSAFRSVMLSKRVIKFYPRLPNMDKECHKMWVYYK